MSDLKRQVGVGVVLGSLMGAPLHGTNGVRVPAPAVSARRESSEEGQHSHEEERDSAPATETVAVVSVTTTARALPHKLELGKGLLAYRIR